MRKILKLFTGILITTTLLLASLMPTFASASNFSQYPFSTEQSYAYELPKLSDKLDYYLIQYPEGLRYSSAWSGTFAYVPNNVTTIMYDDTYMKGWGICILGVPSGTNSPSGPQGGTTISPITIEGAKNILKTYSAERIVKPFDAEIKEVMPQDTYYIGAWAGDKLAQKFTYTEYEKTYKEWVQDPEKGWIQVEKEKVLTERQQAFLADISKAEIASVDLEKYDPDRYFVMGQVFFTDGTADCSLDGRIVADTAFTVAGAGDFTIHMASGTTGTVTGTNITGSPVALAAGLNTITASGAVADGNVDITIGTAANWNSVNSWSAASGGACGASVPTNADSALFDANTFTAGSQVVIVDAVANCLNMDWTGATNNPRLASGGDFSLNIYGNAVFIAAMTNSHVTHQFRGAEKTLTTNGLSFSAGYMRFIGSYTLVDNLTTGNSVWLSDTGALDTAGKTVTCTTFTMGGSGARTITLGASTVNCTEFTMGTNVTVTANTATINVSGTGAVALGTANYDGASFNLNGTAHTVSGSPTGINVFTRNGTATKTDSVTFTSGTTVTCTTFAMIGNSATNRLLVQSSTLGTAATITATNWTGTANVDIMDITATNAIDLSAITGGSGDCGGNTGITFTTAAAQISAATGNWSTLATWQDGVGTDRVPLPQDDVSCSHNVTVDMPRIGKSIAFTGTPTVTLSDNISNYGSFTLSAGCTYAHANKTNYFRGRGNYNLTTNGKTLYQTDTVAPGGTITLQDNLTMTYILNLHNGTMDFNDKNVTIGRLYSWWTTTRALSLGNGTIIITEPGGDKFNLTTTGMTFAAEGSTIILTQTLTDAANFKGGGQTYNNVTVQGTGAYALTITGNNIFNTFKVDDSQAAKTIVATGTTQTVNDFQKDNGGTNVTTLTGGTWTKHGRLVSVTGTFTGSPVYFDDLSETIICTGTGTANVYLPHGVTGTATSVAGGATVTDSPKALVAGVNTIEVTAGGTNDFTIATNSIDSIPIALDYISTNSTAVPANVWYAGSNGTDTGATDWLFDDPALTVTSEACTGVTMDKDGVTGGTFNGTIDTLLEGTPTITTYFEYGLTNAYGSQTADVVIYADGAFTGTIPNGLTPGATYHYRAVATNGNAGSPFNGADATFTFTMPTISTLTPTDVNMDDGTTATLRGQVTNMGVATSTYGYFEWGYDNTYGNVVGLQTINAIGTYTYTLTGYNPLGTVHYRFVAECDPTTTLGLDTSFEVEDTNSSAYGILYIIIPIIIAIGLAISVFFLIGKMGWMAILIAAFVAVIGLVLVQALLRTLW